MYNLKSIFTAAAFFTVAIFVVLLSETSARPTKWSRGSQMDAVTSLRDSTIDTLLIKPEDWAIIAKLRSGVLQSGVVDSNSFTSAWLNILRSSFVGHADTADYAVTSSGMTDSSATTAQLPYRFILRMASTGISPVIPSQRYAMIIDTADGGGSARIIVRDLNGDQSYFIDSAAVVALINDLATDQSDTVQFSYESDHAATADLSYATLQTITVADSTIDSNSFTPAWKNYLRGSFITWSKTADSLTANAIDDYGQFNSSMKSTYIPTAAQKSALVGVVTPGSTNPYADCTYVSNNFLRNLDGSSYPLWFSFHNDADSVGATGKAYFLIDTVGKGITITDLDGTRFAIEDSAATRSAIATIVADYVLKGTGSFPTRLSVTAGTPTGGSAKDWAIDSVAKQLWFYDGDTGWTLVSGGSGADSATTVVVSGPAYIDADSLVTTQLDHLLIHGRWQSDDYYGNSDTAKFTGIFLLDSMRAEAGKTIYVSDTLTSKGVAGLRLTLGAPSQANAIRPRAYLSGLFLGGSGTENFTVDGSTGTTTTAGSISWSVDSSKTVGSVDASGVVGGSSANAPLKIVGHTIAAGDCMYVAGSGYPGSVDNSYVLIGSEEGLITSGLPITTNNEGIVVNNGNIQIQGGSNYMWIGGSQWGSGGISMVAGDSIGINSGGVLKLNEGAKVVIPSDSGAYVRNLADNTTYYWASLEEKNALRTPCPDLSGTNYVISKEWMKDFWTRRLWPTGLFKERKDSLRAYYGAFKNPGCNDSIDFNRFDNVEIVWPVDTTAVPIEWPDTAQALILPWITPGIPVGPYWIDSTSNGIYYADPTPGYGEGILKVDQRANDTLGFISGRYSTINKCADSLVQFRCAAGGDVATAGESGELDTFYVTTKSATIANELSMYRGSVLVQDSIRQILPDFITESGCWVKFEKAGDAAQRWLQVECWINDSTFTVRDSLIRASTIDNTWTLTFAKQQTILIYPPVDGQYINLATAVTISDNCPVKFKGVEKNRVVITNKDRDPTPSVSQLFNVSGTGVNDTYLGMPIEFEDLTLYYEPIGGTVTPSIVVAGNTKFTNCNMIIKSTGAVTNPFIQHNYYDAATITEANRPTLIIGNCVVIADSDVTIFELAADSVLFQSSNSSYSFSGDDGILVYATDSWGDDPPRFSRDDFFFGLSGTYVTPQGKLVETTLNPAGSTEKIPAPACVFIQRDPSTPSNVLTYPSGSPAFVYTSQLFYDASDIKPPAKLRDGAIPIKPKWSPK